MAMSFSTQIPRVPKYLGATVVVLVLFAGTEGSAQAPAATTSSAPTDTSFSINMFQPAPGPHNFFNVESPMLGQNMMPTVGLMMSYQHRPFVLLDCTNDGQCADGPNTIDAVRNLMTFDLLATFTFLDFLQAGLAFPMSYIKGEGFTTNEYSTNPGAQPGAEYAVFVINDLRLHLKARVWGKEGEDGPSLAVALIPTIPLANITGMGQSSDTEDNGAYGYGGDGFLTLVAPKVIFGYQFGPVRSSINIGALWRQKSEMLSAEIGHSLMYSGAVGYSFLPEIEILAELYGNKSLTSASFSDAEGAPLLFLLGGRFRVKDFIISAAGGGGILSGIGVPQFQIVGGVTWVPTPWERDDVEIIVFDTDDRDQDGIKNEADACPDRPEDEDGFEDDDGCPDDDNDQDGVADGYDSCPGEKEDKDGFRDDDGCPDLDHDEDGIEESVDKCPDNAEDFDDFEDTDGCPEEDNDQDGLLDGNDFCMNQAEDIDNFEDEDGCPELDNDQDGVPDTTDQCPDEQETLNGIKDKDGCPDGGKVLVVVTENKIEIKQTILFKTSSDAIKGKKSFEILDIVASVLIGNPVIRISIEGHTDNRGNPGDNRELSAQRAEAVKTYLVRQGVEADRLETVGWGPDTPIADNNTYKGRVANRRVEFVVIRTEGQMTSGDTGEGEGDAGGEMDFTTE